MKTRQFTIEISLTSDDQFAMLRMSHAGGKEVKEWKSPVVAMPLHQAERQRLIDCAVCEFAQGLGSWLEKADSLG